MSERPVTLINLERYRERLDRITATSAPLPDRAEAPPPPEALTLLGQLDEGIGRLAGGVGEGIKPLLAQVREHVEALFPAPGGASLEEAAHTARKEILEELLQTLEGVLYAVSAR